MSQERVTGRLIERDFPVGPDAELHVNNVRGAVRVTGGQTTTIHARIEVDPEHRFGDDDLERAPIELEHEGNQVKIKVLSDKMITGWFERRSGPPEVRCTIEVPARTQANVSVVSADVALGGLEGTQTVNTVSGQVVVTGIRGDVRLNTVSGSAIITDADGAVRWNSVSGDLILRESHPTELKGNSVSGSAEVTLGDNLRGGAGVQTVSGDFRLTVPGTFACEAQLSSMSGRARCTLPMQVQESKRGRWRATVNGGGPLVRLSSMSGSLYLSTTNGSASASAGVAAGSSAQAGPTPGPTPRPAPADPVAQERLRILQQLERKQISIQEAMRRLEALQRPSSPGPDVL